MAVLDRWEDICVLFGERPFQLSEIIWKAVQKLSSKRESLVLDSVAAEYMEERVVRFNKAVQENRGAHSCCVGFLDGTVAALAISKGHMHLLVLYIGLNRSHDLNYQAIMIQME